MFRMTPDEQYVHERSAVTPDGCWLWTGYINEARGGYGTASWKEGGRCNTRSAHKLAYEIFRGPVPTGLELDHAVCQQKVCCNPFHLEPVTRAENQRRNAERGVTSNQNVGKTRCGKCGGPFDMIKNDPTGARRMCRNCSNAYHREWRARRKTGG